MFYVFHTAAGNVTAKALKYTRYFKYSRMLKVMCKDLSDRCKRQAVLFPAKQTIEINISGTVDPKISVGLTSFFQLDVP